MLAAHAPAIAGSSQARGEGPPVTFRTPARLPLSLITLWLLSVIVFAGGQLLPGDVGRAILGRSPMRAQSSI